MKNFPLDADDWHLNEEETAFVEKRKGLNRLRCAVLLKFLQKEARFPKSFDEIPLNARRFLSEQLGASPVKLGTYEPQSGTNIRNRGEIRKFLGFRQPKEADYTAMETSLSREIIEEPEQHRVLHNHLKVWCLEQKIELPAHAQRQRIIKAALAAFETRTCESVANALSDLCQQAVDQMFISKGPGDTAPFSFLKDDPGKPALNSIFVELDKLTALNGLGLPDNVLADVSEKTIQRYRARAGTESIRDMRRHPDAVRYTLATAFFSERRKEIIDGLAELLIQIIHKIQVRAEKKVSAALVKSVKDVSDKKVTLFKLAEASLSNPDGTIRDVLFPVVGEDKLTKLVQEFQADSPVYTEKIEYHIRNSYKNHYRQMVPKILDALHFHSNNQHHRPIIEAVEYLRAHSASKRKILISDIPVEAIIPKSLRSLLIEKTPSGSCINRVSYEICVLRALRDGLRCREIWVEGAGRYRNPDEDLPQDFEVKRPQYYERLDLPLSANDFISDLKSRMEKSLRSLNKTMPRNEKVFVRLHGKNLINVSPLEPQAEPKILQNLKAEVAQRWPLTSLLDIVKEAEFQTGFTDCFCGLGDREILNRDTLRPRLLLALYALGTNTGLKRILAGSNDLTYDELRYVRERYIYKDALRAAIAKVVNATLDIRLPEIWGSGTMGCASDSKKIHAWDQNLMSEWHIRYRGRGVMVYWHVEKNSLCVYSQLKRCSSSEVGAMMEGVLRHCTDAEIEKQYVDSHGQSEVAFAFCELLGFSLMPRLKAIARQKLYLPNSDMRSELNNLTPILKKHQINWDLISRQYDEMVKFAAALQKGSAHAENILRRFTRNNRQHPTYRALAELGRAVKTTFLCQYLESEDSRREIHEALNVVENCNSTVEFIFFARGSEISSNQLANQEISVLALHLLQVCLVYVNTLMIQQILSEKNWLSCMEKEDFRALTPLIYLHITPYGAFDLDMRKSLFPEPEGLKIAV